ncbi:MAG: sensor histidine kinase [Caldilineaceae bacterium]
MDGFETCRRLKANPATAAIPVIFMTSLASAEDKVRGFEVGAVDYVTKPLQQGEVLARITTHLRLYQVAEQLRQEHLQLEVSSKVEKERLFAAVRQQRAQLRALTSKLTEVQENERRQLARELHDELGQALTAIRMDLAAVERALPGAATAHLRERLQEAALLTEQTLEQIRELSLDLRPPMLDDLGLIPTLRWYLKRYHSRTKIKTGLTVLGEERRLAVLIESALYRILQEALTNVARHAAASAVHLTLHYHPQRITANFEDDGRGFDVDAVLARDVGSMGLLGMRERVTLLGGTLQIDSGAQGTQLCFDIPLGEQEQGAPA